MNICGTMFIDEDSPMTKAEPKTEIVRVRLTPVLKAMVEAEANLKGESISTVIRWAIRERYNGRRRIKGNE